LVKMMINHDKPWDNNGKPWHNDDKTMGKWWNMINYGFDFFDPVPTIKTYCSIFPSSRKAPTSLWVEVIIN
jgi:hypothetical protein